MRIKWFNIILAVFTLTMSMQPFFTEAQTIETCCKAETCGGSELPEEKDTAPDSCPNESNPFRLCNCCSAYVLLVQPTFIIDLTPLNKVTVANAAEYRTYLPSAALDECWRPPRLS